MADGQLGSVLRHIRKLAGIPAGEGVTDRQLLACFAARRDQGAFAALVARHGPLVLGVCRRALPNAHDADDAFQATFLVLARKAGSLRWRESIGPWLYGVALRVTRKMKTGAGRRLAHERQAGMLMPRDGSARAGDPLVETGRRELRQVLDEELGRLPRKYRDPLVLCYLEGRTNEEAARALGRPAGSMSRHLARGRELLRERLAHRGIGLPAGLLAAALAEESLAAVVPDALVDSTVQMALAFSEGTAMVGSLSAEAVALAEGVLKAMIVTKLKVAAALVMTAAVLGAGTGGLLHRAGAWPPADDKKPTPAAQAGHANVPQSKSKEESAKTVPEMADKVRGMREKLSTPVNLEAGIPANSPLRDALEFLSDRYDVTILVNTAAFKADGQVDDPQATPVRLPRMIGVPLSTVLPLLLNQVDATYVVRPDFIEITTRQQAWPAHWAAMDRRYRVPAVVDANFTRLPLRQALRQLSEQTGISVVVDGRVLDEVNKTQVTATLSQVPLDTAVRLLADMSDLKAVALDNVLYVTTKVNADALQAEQEKRQQARPPAEKARKAAPAQPAGKASGKEQKP